MLFGENGRYRVIWQKYLPIPYDAFSADLDGDGDDEFVFVDEYTEKVQAFKIVPK